MTTDELRRAAEEYANGLTRVEPARFTRADIEFAFYSGAAHAQRWIPVSERLPEVGKPVVGYRNIMQTHSIVFLSSAGEFMFYYEAEFASDITHWLPLPAAPKEEGK